MYNFNPLSVVTFTRDMLRKLFLEFSEEFKWSEVSTESKIWIGTANDYNASEVLQKIPRVLIQRGPIMMNTSFISNNLEYVEGTPNDRTKHRRQDLQGDLTLIVETVSEGACEVLAEQIRRFIIWSKPFIESEFGFQSFARHIQISPCMPDRENKEKFKIQIAIPFIIEDRWETKTVFIKLKAVFQEIKSS